MSAALSHTHTHTHILCNVDVRLSCVFYVKCRICNFMISMDLRIVKVNKRQLFHSKCHYQLRWRHTTIVISKQTPIPDWICVLCDASRMCITCWWSYNTSIDLRTCSQLLELLQLKDRRQHQHSNGSDNSKSNFAKLQTTTY